MSWRPGVAGGGALQNRRRMAFEITCWRAILGAPADTAALALVTQALRDRAGPGLLVPSAESTAAMFWPTTIGPTPAMNSRVRARARPWSAARTGRIACIAGGSWLVMTGLHHLVGQDLLATS